MRSGTKLEVAYFDQMRDALDLYATLEDKEKELRDFIRTYEKVICCFIDWPFQKH